MAKYVIGDLHGCYSELQLLLQKVDFNLGTDTLYLVGDLVNRGDESLATISWLYKHQDRIISVLGNHDIYLLARYNKIVVAEKDDTLEDIIVARDSRKIIDWLRTLPFIYEDETNVLVHAGIYPQLDFNQTRSLATELSSNIKSNNYVKFLQEVYGNYPNYFSCNLSYIEQMRFMINSCTRMRYLNNHNHYLDFSYKGSLANMPDDLIPWFNVVQHETINKKILFGHWASLGFFHDNKVMSLDTACVWGGKLTAINLDTFEITQVAKNNK